MNEAVETGASSNVKRDHPLVFLAPDEILMEIFFPILRLESLREAKFSFKNNDEKTTCG